MALVTLAELKAALGVGGLYDDTQLQAACDTAELLKSYLATTVTSPDTVPELRQAGLQIAMAVWSARTSPNGDQVGLDYQPSPYKLGRSLLSRVQGLTAPYMNPGVYVG